MVNLIITLILFSCILTGCQTVNVDEQLDTSSTESDHQFPEPERVGVYHKVKKGETIWRIAKAYDVALDDIIRSNKIPDVAAIEQNQLVFIPGVQETKSIHFPIDENSKEFIWPAKGKVIRYFNQKDEGRVSRGIDIQTSPGSQVKAARSGKVVFADYLPGYGHTVILDHLDGYYSVYGHTAKLSVALNQTVQKSEELAYTEDDENASYVHFQIRRNTNNENPMFYLP